MNYNITKEELLSVPSWREYNPKADIFEGEYYCTSVIIIPTLEPSENYDWNKIYYVIYSVLSIIIVRQFWLILYQIKYSIVKCSNHGIMIYCS